MEMNVWKCIACKIGRNTTPIGSHGNSFQEAHGGLIQYRSLSLWGPFLESSVFGGRKRRFSVDGLPNRGKQDAFSNLSRLGWNDVTSTRSCFRTSCVQLFFFALFTFLAKDCVVYCVVIRSYF